VCVWISAFPQLAHFKERVNDQAVRRAARKQDLALDITASAGKAHVGFVRDKLAAAHGFLRPPLKELSLALVNDATMSRLHMQFMSIRGPTDVLTFPIDEDGRGRIISGEVVVCVPEARRRARVVGTTLERELLLYALHGMLHLCGFDDRTAAGFQEMHRTEDQILKRLGVGPVFVPETKPKRNRRVRTGEA
jgi:probable rRNA maturation factor